MLLATALGRASASTAQLIRVQQIQTNLLAADATATNAFLVGGLEPPAQRQAYDDAITAATTGITEAAEAEPADEQALSRLNEELVGLRRADRGRPSQQPAGLPGRRPVPADGERHPAGRRATPAGQPGRGQRPARAPARWAIWPIAVLAVAGLLTLAALVLAQVWLARRFRRRFNPAVVGRHRASCW